MAPASVQSRAPPPPKRQHQTTSKYSQDQGHAFSSVDSPPVPSKLYTNKRDQRQKSQQARSSARAQTDVIHSDTPASPDVPQSIQTQSRELFERSGTKLTYSEWQQCRAQLKPISRAPNPRSAADHVQQGRHSRKKATEIPCKALYLHIQKQKNVNAVLKLLSDCGINTSPIRWVSSIGTSVLEVLVAENRYDQLLADVTRLELKVFSNFDPSTPPERRPGSRPFTEAEKDVMKIAFKKRVEHILHLRESGRTTGHGTGGDDPVWSFYNHMYMKSKSDTVQSTPGEEGQRSPLEGDKTHA